VSYEWKAFELLPGCHIVRTPTRWKRGSDQGDLQIGGIVASTGELTFAVPMKPGYAYEIVFEAWPVPASLAFGEGRVIGHEFAPSGQMARTFRPSTLEEIDSCLDAATAKP
jgi:hypothetical protein